MAEKLDTFDFAANAGRSESYPWDEWLDGNIYRLVVGEDISSKSKVASFRSTAISAAKRRNVGLKTSVVDGNTIVIQAVPVEEKPARKSNKKAAAKG